MPYNVNRSLSVELKFTRSVQHTICFCLMGFIMYDPSDIFSNVAIVMLQCPKYSVE